MRRATIVYAGMLALLIGGLWTIIRVGSSIRPPHDLSGRWLVRPVDSSPDSEPLPMQVIQSGRFLTVEFPDLPPLKVTLKKEELDASGKVTAMYWQAPGAQLVIRLPAPPKSPQDKPRYWFELEKPLRATWRARRVVGDEVAAVNPAAGH